MSAPLSEQQRADIRALLDGAPAAEAELIVSIAETYRDRREHERPKNREDWFCANLAGWMGDRMSVVLSRLLDAETEVERLRAEVAALSKTRAERLREAADMVAAMADPQCHCGGCDSCVAREYAKQLRVLAGKDTGGGSQSPADESTQPAPADRFPYLGGETK